MSALSSITANRKTRGHQPLAPELSGRPCLRLSKGHHLDVMSSPEGQCSHLACDSHITINHHTNSVLRLASQAITAA